MDELCRGLYRMQKIFLLTKQNLYSLAVSNHLLHLQWLRAKNHPVYKLLSAYPQLLNEEVCEGYLSLLANSSCKDSSRIAYQHMEKHFLLCKEVHAIIDSFKEEMLDEVVPEQRWRHAIPESHNDLKATVEFFRASIREITQGTFRPYAGAFHQWTNKRAADETREEHKSVPQWFFEDTRELMASSIDKVRRTTTGTRISDELKQAFRHGNVQEESCAPGDEDSDAEEPPLENPMLQVDEEVENEEKDLFQNLSMEVRENKLQLPPLHRSPSPAGAGEIGAGDDVEENVDLTVPQVEGEEQEELRPEGKQEVVVEESDGEGRRRERNADVGAAHEEEEAERQWVRSRRAEKEKKKAATGTVRRRKGSVRVEKRKKPLGGRKRKRAEEKKIGRGAAARSEDVVVPRATLSRKKKQKTSHEEFEGEDILSSQDEDYLE